MSVSVRPITEQDAETCGKIGFEAHSAISLAHGYPSEQPTAEFGIQMIRMLLGNPNSWGALATVEDRVAGSIFLNTFPPSPVAVIGPLTVRPSSEGVSRGNWRCVKPSAAELRRSSNVTARSRPIPLD